MSSMGLIGAWEWKKLFQCAYHLPGLQLIKQSQFLRQLKIAMEKSILADEMASSFVSWVDTCEELNVNKQWTWEMIEDECTKKDMDQNAKKYLQDVERLFKMEHEGEFVKKQQCKKATSYANLILFQVKLKDGN